MYKYTYDKANNLVRWIDLNKVRYFETSVSPKDPHKRIIRLYYGMNADYFEIGTFSIEESNIILQELETNQSNSKIKVDVDVVVQPKEITTPAVETKVPEWQKRRAARMEKRNMVLVPIKMEKPVQLPVETPVENPVELPVEEDATSPVELPVEEQ